MNILPRSSTRLALAALLLVASLPGHAGETGTGAPADGVGRWIAAQGNTALRQLGDELERDLHRQLKPLLPEITPAPLAETGPLDPVVTPHDAG